MEKNNNIMLCSLVNVPYEWVVMFWVRSGNWQDKQELHKCLRSQCNDTPTTQRLS